MLRDYQVRARDQCARAYAGGARRVLLVLPTGAGKTVVGASCVEGAIQKGRRVLWVVRGRELVDQAASRIAGAAVIMSGRRGAESPIQVASLDTLIKRDAPPADFVVVDEAHHAVAATMIQALSHYPDAHVLGLTATPERSDGTALGEVFDALIAPVTVAELVDLGHLIAPRVIAPASDGDLADDPVSAWRRHSEGRPGLVFAASVSESIRIARELGGVSVDAKTPRAKRDAIADDFRAGRIDVLSSVGIYTEGVDLPRASVALIARGCVHASTYLQIVGRVMRPAPGKEGALVIDLRGAVHRHGLPTDDRTYSLDGRAIRTLDSLPPLTQCEDCGAVWRRSLGRRCVLCGAVIPPPPAPKVDRRPLTEIRGSDSVDRKRATFDRMRATQIERGYKPGWVFARFRATFGRPPPREWW